MKKLFLIPLSLILILFISKCSSVDRFSLGGFYQSELIDNAYIIQISISTEEMKFIEYINNRKVDEGSYKVTDDINNRSHQLIGEIYTSNIVLNKPNSFEIVLENLNEGKPIKLNSIGNVPASFSEEFDDVDKYKSLIES